MKNTRACRLAASIALALGGFTPVFSYNFRTRTLGLSAEIKGITF